MFADGRDYNATFTNITINSSITRILIPIVDDLAVEAIENFTCQITLVSPTSNVLIAQTEAVVVILDNDSKFLVWIRRH